MKNKKLHDFSYDKNMAKENRTFTRLTHRNEPFLNGLSYSYIIDI